MKKKDYLEAIRVAKGNKDILLSINCRLATDIEINSKDKQNVFKAITDEIVKKK